MSHIVDRGVWDQSGLSADELRMRLLYHPGNGQFVHRDWSEEYMRRGGSRRGAGVIRSRAGQVAGWRTDRGYVRLNVLVGGVSRKFMAHRLVWLYHFGVWPREIDHIDGDPSNNRLRNLRDVNHAGNMANRSDNNDFVGVYRRSDHDGWRSQWISGGVQRTRTFSDSRHGGRSAAFIAAVVCREAAVLANPDVYGLPS